MMRSLSSDVGDEVLEGGWRDGLGPVADLPDESLRLGQGEMERATGGSLEAVGDLCDRDTRRMTDNDVDVVVGIAGRDEQAVERSGLSFEQSGEPDVQAWVEPRRAVARRPDQVDDEDGGGVSMPGDERNGRLHRCPVDQPGVLLRG